jgi:hypothetical protein
MDMKMPQYLTLLHDIDFAKTGDTPMAFLHCDGYKIENNCAPSNNKGLLKYENRYD